MVADLIRWGNVSFFATPTGVRGLTNIGISAGAEVEEYTVDGEKFARYKNGNPAEVTLTALLDRRLGEDVQGTAMALVEMAQSNVTGYLYALGGKLFTNAFLLTEAEIGSIELSPSGIWVKCEATLKLIQATKKDGTTQSSVKKNAYKTAVTAAAAKLMLGASMKLLGSGISNLPVSGTVETTAVTNAAKQQSLQIVSKVGTKKVLAGGSTVKAYKSHE